MNLKFAYFFHLLVIRTFFRFVLCCVALLYSLLCHFEFVKFGPSLFIAFHFYLPIVNNKIHVHGLSKCGLRETERKSCACVRLVLYTYYCLHFYHFNQVQFFTISKLVCTEGCACVLLLLFSSATHGSISSSKHKHGTPEMNAQKT